MLATAVDRRTRAATLAVACAALFLIFLDNTIVNVALPSIQRSLAATPDLLEWAVNAYVVVFAGLVLLAGKLGDKHGRRRLFAAGLVIFGAASAAAATAADPASLIAARAGQGVGAALLAPLSCRCSGRCSAGSRCPRRSACGRGSPGLGSRSARSPAGCLLTR
jgi:MFS family permease